MQVAAIIFLFLIRLQLPKSKSISVILRRTSGQSTLKKQESLKNLIIVYAKLTADLVTFTEEILNGKLHFCAVAELGSEFLLRCRDGNVIPNFLAANLLKLL